MTTLDGSPRTAAEGFALLDRSLLPTVLPTVLPNLQRRPHAAGPAGAARVAGSGSRPRIAVLNEWFEASGGAERVLLSVLDALPDATPYALWRDHDAVAPDRLRETWLARTPLRGRKALTLPLIPLVWRTQTRQRYDIVISLSHALNHTARLPVREGGVHLSYVHTPARYLWLPGIDGRRKAVGQRAAVAVTKRMETRLSRHVVSYAANSQEVRQRIQRFWNRDARVIHPPVRTGFFSSAPFAERSQNRDYILGVGRWILYKNFDFMIEVAARAGLPLVLAGAGPMEARLRELAAAACVPVTFEHRPDDERLRELMWGARCLLFPCHEDFGIVPVEAQACGTPVVGLNRGGLRETVRAGETGFLLDDLDRTAVMRNAGRFSEASFRSALDAWIADVAQGVDAEAVPEISGWAQPSAAVPSTAGI